MAGDIGNTTGTTFNLPNFVGELFGLTPTETPLLSMIGGLTGGKAVTSTIWTWQNYDLADAAQPDIAQGDDPTYQARIRDETSNVVQIHQKGVKIAYTKKAAVGELGPYAADRGWSIMGNQPVQSEMDWQLQLAIEETARDVEYSFIQGAYQKPADNNSGRMTRGLLAAITTNVEAQASAEVTFTATAADENWSATGHGLVVGDEVEITTVGTGGTPLALGTHYWVATVDDANTFSVSTNSQDPVNNELNITADTSGTWKYTKVEALTSQNLDDLMLSMFDSGAPLRNPVFLCNGFQKQRISTIYGYAPEDRMVGGVNIQQLETDFGRIGIVVDRHVPADVVLLADVSVLTPVFLAIPGNGHFFLEPLAKTGSYDAAQLYGEIGLEYGPERWHGKITGLETRVGI